MDYLSVCADGKIHFEWFLAMVVLLKMLRYTSVQVSIGVREKEGSGTSPLNSVSDGNMCPTVVSMNQLLILLKR